VYSESMKLQLRLDTTAQEIDKQGRKIQRGLDRRLAQSAKTFGRRFESGMKKGIKFLKTGGMIGAIGGLISTFLNPVQELEQKLEELLSTSRPYGDLAARLNTSEGQVRQIEAVAGEFGVPREEVKELLTEFADAIKKGRTEVADRETLLARAKTEEERANVKALSPSTQLLLKFLDAKDLAQAFLSFQRGLADFKPDAQGMVNIPVGEEGATRPVSIDEFQKLAESEIFGQALNARQSAFAKANFSEVLKTRGIPSAEQFDRQLDRIEQGEVQLIRQRTSNEDKQLRMFANQDVRGAISGITRFEQQQFTTLLKKFDELGKLQATRETMEEVRDSVESVKNEVVKGFGEIVKEVKNGTIINTLTEGFKGMIFGDKESNTKENLNRVREQKAPTGARRGAY
jgi:hypothetical protein